MTSIQYNELFNFLVKRFDAIDERFDKIETRSNKFEFRLGRIENTQDHILGELKALSEERIIGTHRTNEIEDWVIKAAKKINLPYHP